MTKLYVIALQSQSWLAALETPVIPRIGETIKLGSEDHLGREVLSVDYTFGTGEDTLTYVTVVVGPQRKVK